MAAGVGGGYQPSSAQFTTGRNLTKTVSDFHQHIVVGMADIADDVDDFLLQFSAAENNNNTAKYYSPDGSGVGADPTLPPPSCSQSGSSAATFCGVFPGAQHGRGSPLRNYEHKALARIRGAAVASSCSTLLRHSVSMPNTLKAVNSRCGGGGSGGGGGAESTVMRSKSTGSAQPSPTGLQPFASPPPQSKSLPMRGSSSHLELDAHAGRTTTTTFPGLDDHRYTLKPAQSPSNRTLKVKRTTGGATGGGLAAGTDHHRAAILSGSMSILEAFLRSTLPMDPNKGSDAVLASKGLSHLDLDDATMPSSTHIKDDPDGAGTLLKKLLTGEIDHNEVHRSEQQVIYERRQGPLPAVDSPLIDGFGLDVDLNDPQSLGIGLLGADCGERTWMPWESEEPVRGTWLA